MGQSPSSVRSKSGRQRSFRGFVRRSKLNKSSLSHTFSLPPSDEYPELMNINFATEEQLMTLPGVNRQLAREIVRHRQMIGRFKRVDDLALVSGIGAEKLEVLRPEICANTKKALSRASSCTQSLDSVRVNNDNKLCSVNSSSVFQLQCVPGLNQEIAANIVDHRNKKGPFKSLDDLIKVRGMDIVRLSTVKHHLSLEPRKCESVQQLANGHVNGWSSFNGSMLNGISSTPKMNHKKSLSMPTRFPVTLPNGFATAPVNDILDLLSAYSHRPIIEEEFQYERDGQKCCRLASWNLCQLTVDKISNPGVREVVCRTILENKLSLVAIQDVVEAATLRIICEELNAPHLRRVREWKSNSHQWQHCVSERDGSETVGFIFDAANKSGVQVEELDLGRLQDLVEDEEGVRRLLEDLARLKGGESVSVAVQDIRPLRIIKVDNLSGAYLMQRTSLAVQRGNTASVMGTFGSAFLLCGRPLVFINLQCRGTLDGDVAGLLCKIGPSADAVGVQVALAGEFWSWESVYSLQSDYQTLLSDEVQTTLDSNVTGQAAILSLAQIEKTSFNGHAGVVKSGLSHLAIPRGWSWGGPASPHCPVWAEVNLPD